MRVEVDARATPDGLVARCWVFNDSAEVVELDERCLVGPNVVPETPPPGFPFGVSVSAYADPTLHQVRLLPGQIIGRERRFPMLRAGHCRVHAYLVADPSVGLRAAGPSDPANALTMAVPVDVDAGIF